MATEQDAGEPLVLVEFVSFGAKFEDAPPDVVDTFDVRRLPHPLKSMLHQDTVAAYEEFFSIDSVKLEFKRIFKRVVDYIRTVTAVIEQANKVTVVDLKLQLEKTLKRPLRVTSQTVEEGEEEGGGEEQSSYQVEEERRKEQRKEKEYTVVFVPFGVCCNSGKNRSVAVAEKLAAEVDRKFMDKQKFEVCTLPTHRHIHVKEKASKNKGHKAGGGPRGGVGKTDVIAWT